LEARVIAADGNTRWVHRREQVVPDADGQVVMPGMVDVHNHMHDDELFPEGIDFGSGTAAALAGGRSVRR